MAMFSGTALLFAALGSVLVPAWRAERHKMREVRRIRLESQETQRRMHDLTREAFVAMIEHVERGRTHDDA